MGLRLEALNASQQMEQVVSVILIVGGLKDEKRKRKEINFFESNRKKKRDRIANLRKEDIV